MAKKRQLSLLWHVQQSPLQPAWSVLNVTGEFFGRISVETGSSWADGWCSACDGFNPTPEALALWI